MFGFIKKLFGGNNTDYKALMLRGAVIIDVRSASEFQSGHIKGAKNMPVDLIKNKVAELKKQNKPVITVCHSGSRSGMAKSILSSAGIEVYNGGPWFSLQKKI